MLDFMEYALLQMGQEQRAKQIRDDNNAIAKLAFDYNVGSWTGLAAAFAKDFAIHSECAFSLTLSAYLSHHP